MATKNKDPFSSNFNIDDDYNIDSKWDEFDSGFDDFDVPSEPVSKSRKAIGVTKKAAVDTLSGTSSIIGKTLQKDIERSMPKTKAAADMAMGFVNEMSLAKQELLKSGGEIASQTKSLVRSLLPQINKIVPSGLQKKLENFAKEEEKPEQQANIQEEERSRLIQESIGNALKLQTAQNIQSAKEQRYNTIIDRKINEKRHISTLDVLNSLKRNSEYQVQFYKTVTTGYYNKSLELQYKQYFVSKDMLATMQIMSKILESRLSAIQENSSLPDIQKQRLSESYKQIARDKFFGRVNSLITDKMSNFGRNIVQAGKKRIQENLSNVVSGMQAMNMGLDMAGSFSFDDPNMVSDEDTGNFIVDSGKEMLANSLGERIGKKLYSKLNPTLRKKILSGLSSKPEELFDNFQKKLYLGLNRRISQDSNSFSTSTLDNLKSQGLSFLADVFNLNGRGDVSFENQLTQKSNEPATFDNLTRTSIVEIIPRLLSKIEKNIRSIRTGKNEEELVYDTSTRDFVKESLFKNAYITRMHGNKETRRNESISKGVAVIEAGLRHHNTEKEFSYGEAKKDFKKNLETFIRNHVVLQWDIDFNSIKYLATQNDENSFDEINSDFYKADDYGSKVFKNIENKDKFIKLLYKALFDNDGKLNHVIANGLNDALFSAMGDDEYKEDLYQLIEQGKSYLVSDHFKEKKIASYNGSFDLDVDNIIKKYKEDYNEEYAHEDMLREYENIYKKLSNTGFTLNDILSMIPNKSARVYLKKKFSKENRTKQYFGVKQFNKNGKISEDEFGKDIFDKSKNNKIQNVDSTEDISVNNNQRINGLPYFNTSYLQNVQPHATFANIQPSKISFDENLTLNTNVKNFSELKTPIENIQSILTSHFEWQKTEFLQNLSDNAGSSINSNESILEYLKSISENTSKQIEQLKLTRDDYINLAKLQFEQISALITGKVSKNSFKKFWDFTKSTGGKTLDFIKSSMSKSFDFTKSIGSGAFDLIKTLGPSALTASGNILGGLASGAGSLTSKVLGINWEATKGIFSGASKFGKFIADKFKSGSSSYKFVFRDLYIPGQIDPVITKQQFEDGVYAIDKNSNTFKRIESLMDISGSIFDNSGNVIVNKRDVLKLIDKDGTPLSELIKNNDLFNNKKSKSNSSKGFLNGLGSIAGGIGKFIGGSFGLSSKMMGLGIDAFKGIAGAGGALFKRLLGLDDGSSRKSIKKEIIPRLDTIIKLLKYKNGQTFGDTDGDGIREGSYQDYIKEKEEKKNKNENLTGLEKLLAKYNKEKEESGGSFLSTIFFLLGGRKLLGLFEKVKNFLKMGLSGLGKFLMKGLSGGVKGIVNMLLKLLGFAIPGIGSLAGKGILESSSAIGDFINDKLNIPKGSNRKKSAKKNFLSKAKDFFIDTGKKVIPNMASSAVKAEAIGLGASGLLGSSIGASSLANKLSPISSTIQQVEPLQKGFLLGKNTNMEMVAGKTASNTAKSQGLFSKLIDSLPDKLISKESKEKIKNIIPNIFKRAEKRGGHSLIKRILGRLAAGPFAVIVTAGSIGYEGIHAMINAKELMGLPDDCDLSIIDRGLIGAAAAISEGIFFGMLDTPWLASMFGVDVEKIKATSKSENDFSKKAVQLEKAKLSAGTTSGYAYSQLTQKQTDQINTQNNSVIHNTLKSPTTHDFSIKANQNNPLAVNYKPGYAQAAMQAFVNEDGTGPSVGEVTQQYATLSKGFDNIKPIPIAQSNGNKLGDFVKKFESGSTGASTIAWDRTGGTSYGTYQLAAKKGAVDAFMKWCETKGGDIGKKVASMCKGIKWDTGSKHGPGPEAWKKLAAAGYIQDLEYKYIKETQFDVALRRLPDDIRNVISSSRALQEMLWSTVVQHGIGSVESQKGALRIFTKCWKPGIKLDEYVKSIYADRSSRFKASTASDQNSIRNRFKKECAIILGMLGNNDTAVSDNTQQQLQTVLNHNWSKQSENMTQSAPQFVNAQNQNTSNTSQSTPFSGNATATSNNTNASFSGNSSSGSVGMGPGKTISVSEAALLGAEAGAAGKGGIVRPTQSNVVTSPFGPRNVPKGSKYHKGIDLRARMGQPIFAMKDGTVGHVGGRYGIVAVDHGDGLISRYLHLSKYNVKPGQPIKAGDTVGYAGGTGPDGINTYTPHLHLDVIKNNQNIDPEQFLKSAGVNLSRKGEPGNNDMAPLSDIGAEPKTGNEESSVALKKDIDRASGTINVANGTTQDTTQITSTSALTGNDTSTISSAGSGSVTATNVSNMEQTPTQSFSPSSFSQSVSNGMDISSLVKILEQTNVFLSTIATNSELLKQLNNIQQMNPMVAQTSIEKNGLPQHEYKKSSSQTNNSKQINKDRISSPILDVSQGSLRQQSSPIIM